MKRVSPIRTTLAERTDQQLTSLINSLRFNIPMQQAMLAHALRERRARRRRTNKDV